MISYFVGSVPDNSVIILPVLILSALFSVYHFCRAGKDLFRSPGSPVSLEIFLYLLYLVLSAFALFLYSVEFIIAASAAGMILLVMTDMEFSQPDKRINTYFHSGQNLLTCLLLASFLSVMKAPFFFIAVIKLLSGIYNGYSDKLQNVYFSLRILRIALLLAAGISLMTQISYSDPIITIMFLSGELLDRIMFYDDLKIKY